MPASTYDQEQAKLRRNSGAPTDEDLDFEVPVGMPEVNSEIFRDVEPLLFKGFVYARAVINNVSFVFKSLNQHEFEMLALLGHDLGSGAQKTLQKQYDMFLALGVLYIDGVCVLPDRDKWLGEIAGMFGNMPDGVRRKVVDFLSELNRRANRAVILTEAYCMDGPSRLRWSQYRGLDLTSSSVTGFPGTGTLGMNWGQLVWRAVNNFEDLRDTAEREWENAKFIASASAGKGMSRIYAQDKQRHKTEREEKLKRRDRILRFALLNEHPDGPSKSGGNVKVARTVQELAQQLKNDLSGEKDWHDMVVQQYEQRAKNAHQSRMQLIQERQAEFQATYGSRGVVGGTSVREEDLAGLTPEEVQFRIQRRRQLTAQRLASQAQLPELHDPKAAQFLDKWAGGSADAPQRPKALPFKRGDR